MRVFVKFFIVLFTSCMVMLFLWYSSPFMFSGAWHYSILWSFFFGSSLLF